MTGLFGMWARKYSTDSCMHLMMFTLKKTHHTYWKAYWAQSTYLSGALLMIRNMWLYYLQQTSLAELASYNIRRKLSATIHKLCVLAVFKFCSKLLFIWYKLHMWVPSEDHKVHKAVLCSWLQHGRTLHHYHLRNFLEWIQDSCQHTQTWCDNDENLGGWTWGSQSTPESMMMDTEF